MKQDPKMSARAATSSSRPGIVARLAAQSAGDVAARFLFTYTILIAAVSGATADDGKARPAASDSKTPVEAAKKTKAFDLRIVTPDGKPLPEVKVELRTSPVIEASQIRTGKYVRRSRTGVSVKADGEGHLVFERAAEPKRFDLYVQIPGYAPYWAGWDLRSKSEPIPDSLTIKLEPAWTIGGVVVDGDGHPIPNVRISFYIEFTKRPGDSRQMGTGDRRWTNSKGEWKFESVPASLNAVSVEMSDPNYMTLQSTLSRASFGIEPGRSPVAKITLKRGLTVTGKVTDENGKPIAKAVVRTKFGNIPRSAVTDAKGVYKLEGCDPGQARIVVSAKGRARALQEVQIGPHATPVDFEMSPGKTLRIRVLDEQGKPVPKATVFFQNWRGRVSYFEFDQVPRDADERGAWEWNEAPPDPLEVDIGRPDGLYLSNRPVVAGEKEFVFRVPPALVISGKVIDSETKQAIKKFRVVPGIRWSAAQTYWNTNESFTGTDGRYEYRQHYEQPAYLVRIEADGHLPSASRPIKSDEGKVTIDFALEKGKDINSTVLTAVGVPASRANVAIASAGSYIMLDNGDFSQGQTSGSRQITDEAGHFHFGPQTDDFWLVAIHPSGYANVKCSSGSVPKFIALIPWARVEGTFRVARKPQSGATVSIDHRGNMFRGPKAPSFYLQYTQTTDAKGRFVFERVVPGEGTIGRRILIMANTGTTEVTSTSKVAVKFTAGKITRVDLGGAGRPVIGQLQSSGGAKQEVSWNFLLIEVNGNGRHFTATVDRDGNFSIDDVPAGDYTLTLQFVGRGGGGSIRTTSRCRP
jgi:uncharacterized GH25 family protein